MTESDSTAGEEPGILAGEMTWLVLRIDDGETVSEHRTERAAVRRARELGDGHTVRQAGVAGRTRMDVERRTERYLLRLTPSRRRRWQAAADSAGLSLNEWITQACDGEIGEDEGRHG